MDKSELVERAKMYLKMLVAGVNPVLGVAIPDESVLADERIKRCFTFVTEVLDEYTALARRVEELENTAEQNKIVVLKKREFSITQEQSESIKLSKEPITMLAFMKNINSVIDTDSTEKLSSTRINKWLTAKGLITESKVPTTVNKTVYKPSAIAAKIGIVEESVVDKRSGEVKMQIKLDQGAQLFIVENIMEIIATT